MLGPYDLVLCSPPLAHIPLLDRLAPAQNAGFAAASVTPGDLSALEEQDVSLRDLSGRLFDHGLAWTSSAQATIEKARNSNVR